MKELMNENLTPAQNYFSYCTQHILVMAVWHHAYGEGPHR